MKTIIHAKIRQIDSTNFSLERVSRFEYTNEDVTTTVLWGLNVKHFIFTHEDTQEQLEFFGVLDACGQFILSLTGTPGQLVRWAKEDTDSSDMDDDLLLYDSERESYSDEYLSGIMDADDGTT